MIDTVLQDYNRCLWTVRSRGRHLFDLAGYVGNPSLVKHRNQIHWDTILFKKINNLRDGFGFIGNEFNFRSDPNPFGSLR